MKAIPSTMIRRVGRWLNVLIVVLMLALVTSTVSASNLLSPAAGAVTKTDAIIGDDGDGKADPGETIEYTVVIPNTVTDALGVMFDDNPDANTTFVPSSLATSPVGVNDTYPQTVIGNVSINSALISYSVVSNDFLGLNPTATISVYDATSAQGGQVNMTTSGAGMGQFTYNPPPGFEGTDTFTYTLSDNTNATSAAPNRTATVSITVSGMVWFINNGASACTTLVAGCGRLSNPFSTLAAFNALNNGTGNNPADNDNIFIYESATQYTGAVTLRTGQKLIGQDATASLSTITGLTTPSSSATFPTMNSANGTVTNIGSTVTLNTNATVRGLQINSTTSTGMNDSAGAITGVSVSEVSVTTTTGTAVSLSNAGGTLSFTSISANGAVNGVNLSNTTGSFTVTGDGSQTSGLYDRDGSGGTLNATTGHAVLLTNASNVTLRQMNITNTAAGGTCPGSCTANGVHSSSGSNIVLSAVNLQNLGGHGWYGLNLAGTNRFDHNGKVENWQTSNAWGIYIDNTNTNFSSFTVDHSLFTTSATGADGFLFDGNGNTSGTVNVTSSEFTLIDQDAVQVNNDGSGDMTVVVQTNNFHDADSTSGDGNNTLFLSNAGSGDLNFTIGGAGTYPTGLGNRFDNVARLICACGIAQVNAATTSQTGTRLVGSFLNNTINNSTGRRGIDVGIEANGGAHGGHDITIEGNTITNTVSMGINVLVTSVNGGTSTNNEFTILNNTVTMTGPGGTADSGTALEFETNDANANGAISNTVLIQGNTLTNNNSSGVGETLEITNRAVNSGVNSTMNLTILDNTFTNSNAAGQVFEVLASGISGTQNLCLDMNAANVPANANLYTGAGVNGYKLTNNYGTYRIDGMSAGAQSAANVQTFISARNSSQTVTAGGTVGTFVGEPSGCSTPVASLVQNNLAMIDYNDNAFKQTSYMLRNEAKNTNAAPVINPIGSMQNTLSSKPHFAPLQAGGIVSVNVGTLPAGKSVTIKYRVTVNGPSLPLGTFQISNQGTVSGSNFSNVLTDDPSVGGTSDPTTTPVDRPDTTVTSISRNSASPTNASSVSWTVTFADAIINLTSSNLNLVNGGLGGSPAISSVIPVGGPPATQWTVTASTGTGDGTLELRMANDTSLSHDVTNLPFSQPSSGAVYTIDKTPPTVTDVTSISNTGCNIVSFTNYCNAGDVVNIQVTFSEAVNVSGAPTLTLDLDGTDRDAVYNSAASTSTVLVFDYTVQAGDNTDPAALPPNELDYVNTSALSLNGGTIQDEATNNADLTLASSGTAGSLGANTNIVIDTTAPSTTSFTRFNPATNPTNADILIFQVTFSEDMQNVGISDFVVHDNSPLPTTTTAIDSVSGGAMVFNLTLDGTDVDPGDLASFNGAVGLDFNSAAPANFITDRAGNNLPKIEPATDQEYTVDNIAPAGTINQAAGQNDPTNASPINFTVVFSEAVTGFATGDVTLSGTAGATTAVVTGSGTTYNVAVSGMTSDGTVIASIGAGVATDAVGNDNAASTSTDNTVTYDTAGPTVTINQTSSQSDPTNASLINFTVIFSEPVTNFATGDVTLSGTAGAATGTVTEIAPNNGTTYNVAVSGMTSDGTVIASIGAGVATDAAGNGNAASTSTDNTVTFDGTSPTVTINQAAAQADPTGASPINFTVVFSEAVTGFATGDVTLSSTANPAIDTVTEIAPNNGTAYNVAVSGMANDGTVIASIGAGVATDAAGNGNAASTSTDNTVTYDATGATVTINQAAGQADPTNASPINFTVVFSEAVTGFATGDVTLSGTADATTAVVTGSGTTYNVAVSGMTSDGTVIASINAGVALDSLGNGNAASTSTDNTVMYDTTGPTVTINQAAGQSDPTSGSPINFTVVFSEAVTGFTNTDVTLGGTANPTTAVVTGSGTTYNVAVSGMTSNGTVSATVNVNAAVDAAGNSSAASTSTDNTVTYAAASLVEVTIAGDSMGSFMLSSGEQVSPSFPGTFAGPVQVNSTNNDSLIVSQRQIFGNSFSETLGVPDNQLTTQYWFSWYDGLTMNTWVSIGAPTTNSTDAQVDVYIGNTKMNSTPYVIPPGGQQSPKFDGMFAGPVRVVSTNGQNIIASERQIFGNSFTETLGIPNNRLTTQYWFSWYDGITMNTWVSIGAPTTNSTDALVDIYIGNTKMNSSSYVIPPGGQVSPNFPGMFAGPVRVVSTNGQNIIASQRQIYRNSFTETLGVPNDQLTTQYWFSWYDGLTMSTWISVAAPTTNSTDANVDIYIGGTKMNGSPYVITAGGQISLPFAGTFDGPVRVVSTNGQNIIASERQIFGSSFTETLGVPNNQLDTQYWFSWYDGLTMSTWISIGKP